jgi:hypothetical protein
MNESIDLLRCHFGLTHSLQETAEVNLSITYETARTQLKIARVDLRGADAGGAGARRPLPRRTNEKEVRNFMTKRLLITAALATAVAGGSRASGGIFSRRALLEDHRRDGRG